METFAPYSQFPPGFKLQNNSLFITFKLHESEKWNPSRNYKWALAGNEGAREYIYIIVREVREKRSLMHTTSCHSFRSRFDITSGPNFIISRWRREITTLTHTHTHTIYIKTTSDKQDWRKTKGRWKRVKWRVACCVCCFSPPLFAKRWKYKCEPIIFVSLRPHKKEHCITEYNEFSNEKCTDQRKSFPGGTRLFPYKF